MIEFRTSALVAAIVVALAPAAGAGEYKPVDVQKVVPFADNSGVRDEVKSECQLQTRLPNYIVDFAKGNPPVQLQDELGDSGASTRQLHIVIEGVNEGGNWFVGRHKGVTVSGELKEGDQIVGSFRAARNTSGGFAGGYKGACSFVSRCAKALGKDIAGWLRNPTMNAGLGDL
jgi:hypothetical protein